MQRTLQVRLLCNIQDQASTYDAPAACITTYTAVATQILVLHVR